MRQSDIPTNLPDHPGVYFFQKGTDILYIGKATSLRDRVKSYFNTDIALSRGPKILKMVAEANTITWQETDSVLEALISESNLIKKHTPVYNTREKDDKSYNYVVITAEDFPRIFTVRERDLLKAGKLGFKVKKTFGPFPSGTQLRDALKIIRKIFPFRDKKANDDNQSRFYQMIHLSPDTSAQHAKESYSEIVKSIALFFEGKKNTLVRNLTKQMNAHAKKRAFEQADMIKKQLFALQHIQDVALIKDDLKIYGKNIFRIESYDVAHLGGENTVGVMTVVENGEIRKEEYRKFNITNNHKGSDTHALVEILERRLPHTEWRYPNLIVVDGSLAQKRTAEKVLRDAGVMIPIVAITKDLRHKPKEIKGDKDIIKKYESEILLSNAEAHRFAITFHRLKRDKAFK
jgi:excinuclease ABC subunit C